jgi:hypothetical protein
VASNALRTAPGEEPARLSCTALYDDRVTSPAPPPPPQHPLDPAPRAAGRRAIRVWDIVLTVLLLLAVAGVTLIVSIFGLYLSMAADACGVRDCDTDLIAVGMLLAAVIPWIVLAVTVVASIVLLILRRLAFWVPIAGGVLVVVAFFIGGGLATAGVPPA